MLTNLSGSPLREAGTSRRFGAHASLAYRCVVIGSLQTSCCAAARSACAVRPGGAAGAQLDFRVRGPAGTVAEPGARVIDIGAGDAPYRELFSAQDYLTLDHEQTPHTGNVDIIGSAEAIPVGAESSMRSCALRCWSTFPSRSRRWSSSTASCGRRPPDRHCAVRLGGARVSARLLPLYQGRDRVSAHSAGFANADVRPRTDSFTTLAQLVRNVGWVAGAAPDGLNELRSQARATLDELSDALVALAPLDVEHKLPLGFTVSRKPPGRPRDRGADTDPLSRAVGRLRWLGQGHDRLVQMD